MSIHETLGGRYLIVTPFKGLVIKNLIGYSRLKLQKDYKVENNLVNRIVLGLDPIVPEMKASIKLKPEYLAPLKRYQQLDVLKLATLKNSLNINPMGLGKTLETLTLLKGVGIGEGVLVIAPKSVLGQWKGQVAKWWNEVLDKVDILPEEVKSNRIIIINYERLLNEEYLAQLKAISWEAIVCDEAHRIGNRKAQRSIALNQLKSEYKFALTGTPIINKPDGIWGILNWLDWRYGGNSYWNFVGHFCELNPNWGYTPKGLIPDPARQAILATLVKLISVRNEDIGSGVEQFNEVVELEMDYHQRKFYDNTKKLILEELPEGIGIPNGAVLMLRLQQITSAPTILDPKCKDNIKLTWLKDKILDTDEKIVVFTKFRAVAKFLADQFSNVGALTLHGEMTPTERTEVIEQFQKPEHQLLIGTYGAMSQGIDGLQFLSRLVVFYDRDWSSENMAQAEARVNRYGQQNHVTVYTLDCKKSVDEYVGKVNLRKREDVELILNAN